MQEKKNIGLLISLIVLLAGTAAVYFFQRDSVRASVDPSLFKVSIATIDRFTFDRRGEKIDVHFDGTRWRINDRYEADRQLVDVFFATMERAMPKRPVAILQRDSVLKRLEEKGTRVSLFEGPTLRKQFLAGGNAEKTEAYFSQGKNEQAYVMTIPGYRVYVSQIFELDENGWRDKRIFNFNWRNFKTLTVKFPAEPSADFEFVRNGSVFNVVGVEQADTTRANAFLDDIIKLAADQVVVPGTSRTYDSLVKTKPVCSMVILDIANRTLSLDLFAPVRGDNKVVGRAFGGETVLFDRKKTFPVLKKRSYFQRK
jgi:hypothetical protein